MPTTKLSTSINPLHKLLLETMVSEGDYKALLNELLAVIHRDGGQYTELAGFAVSVEEAIVRVTEMRMEIQNLFNERKKKRG